MSTEDLAGFGLIIKLFKVVDISSRPFEVQGMAKYQTPIAGMPPKLFVSSVETSLYP